MTAALRRSLSKTLRFGPGDCIYPPGYPRCAGSYGIAVYDPESDECAFITASHVVGSLSEAAGKTDEVFLADFTVGSAADALVGMVVRSEPPAFTDQIGVDAALVRPKRGVTLGSVVRSEEPSAVLRDITAEPLGGEVLVHKRGWNGFTTGLLERQPTILEVDLKRPDGSVEVATYYDGYFIHSDGREPFARPGDSGAIVIDDDDCVIGMVVAVQGKGQSADDKAFCVPIVSILEALRIDLVGPNRHCSLAV